MMQFLIEWLILALGVGLAIFLGFVGYGLSILVMEWLDRKVDGGRNAGR